MTRPIALAFALVAVIVPVCGFAPALAGPVATAPEARGVAAGSAVVPRLEVQVNGAQLRLNDLFEGLGEDRTEVVGQAPAPGAAVVLDARFLTQVARLHRLDWQSRTYGERILVRRAGMRVGADVIQAALEEAIARKISAGRLEVTLDNPELAVVVPVGEPARVTVEYLDQPNRMNRFRAVVIVSGAQSHAERVQVSGRATAWVEVPVLTRPIKAGETVGSADIGWMQVEYDPQAGDLITDAGELIGQSPRRMVAVSRPLRQRDFQVPRLVTKGALVTMVLRTPTMLLTAQGRALQEGGRGEVIRVANIQTNRMIEAVVDGPNQVRVVPPGLATN